MPIPKERFAVALEHARARFADAGHYPLIDQGGLSDLLNDAYDQQTDNAGTRAHLESLLASNADDLATRFTVLSYYYGLVHFSDSYLKEEMIDFLRQEFRRDLAFLVRLRATEDCVGFHEICWEIVNACTIRDWVRVRELYRLLRSTGELDAASFHTAYGLFLYRAAFDDSDAEVPEDDSEVLAYWSVPVVLRMSEPTIYDTFFEAATILSGVVPKFALPAGKDDELLRDAKNELEKAREKSLPQTRPEIRSALARCYMASGEYARAAIEYENLDESLIGDGPLAQILDGRSTVWSRIAEALELALDETKLRHFLENWMMREPSVSEPRERLAKVEARSGNYEAAFLQLSEANALNPTQNSDWKSTLLVELGSRAGSTQQFASVIQKSLDRNSQLEPCVDALLGHYWPKFQHLSSEAKQSFRIATLALFWLEWEGVWITAAFEASKSIELQLKATIFEPFAEYARRSAKLPIRPIGDTRPQPLAAFVQKGSAITFVQMAISLIRAGCNPQDGVEQLLRGWLHAHKKQLLRAIQNRILNEKDSVVLFRNDAAHASISRQQAIKLYEAARVWHDELQRDQ